MIKVLHNPKSHAPAIYVPCWLLQVSSKILSHAAKILYGRLSQWANESGKVYRTIEDLAEEMGVSTRSIKAYLKELRDIGLIGTYHPEDSGFNRVNYFEFYDHALMHAPIKDQLVYKSWHSQPSKNTNTIDKSSNKTYDDSTEITHEESPSVQYENNTETPSQPVSADRAGSCPIIGQDPALSTNNINISKNINKPIVDFQSTEEKAEENVDELFHKFYSAYPNKQKPAVAQKAFKKLKPSAEFVAMLCADVLMRIKTNWSGRPKNMIPHPATYLNSREWEGEVHKSQSNGQKQSKYKNWDEIAADAPWIDE